MSRLVQRSDDTFDQLVGILGSVCEQCLPSFLRALFQWHSHQMVVVSSAAEQAGSLSASSSGSRHSDKEKRTSLPVGLSSGQTASSAAKTALGKPKDGAICS